MPLVEGARCPQHPEHGAPGAWRLVRNLMPLAAFIVLPFSGVLMVLDALMIFRGDRPCLHDLLAGTNVVKTPDE